jgi:type IV secretion system protein VirB5
MKSLKQWVAAFVVVVAGFVSVPAHAGIPVIDAMSLADDITNEVSNLAQYVSQYNTLVQQYNQAIEQYNSLNGVRNFQSLFNNPDIRTFLPQQWGQLYQQAMQANNCVSTLEAGKLATCNLQAKQTADQTIVSNIQAQIAQRRQDIQTLINQLANAPDAKDTADLQARIQGEEANLQNEQAELALYYNQSQAQDVANDQLALTKVLSPQISVTNPFDNLPAAAGQ